MSIIPTNGNQELPSDLVGVTDATKLIPSSVPGKKLNVNTLRRWIFAGKIRAWRVGKALCVSVSDVQKLFEPVVVRKFNYETAGAERRRKKREEKAKKIQDEWTDNVLKSRGLA